MKTQRGMSLIEIMVGVVIGLIGCVVIFQMYMVAEGRKRTVSSGSDMEISGRLGLMSLERDLQMAGYGYGVAASATATVAGPALGCNVTAYDTARPAPDFTYTFAPVVITDGAAGAPDSMAVLRGSSSFLAIAKIIDSGSATSTRVKADTGGRTGVGKGDVILNVHRAAGPPAVHQCAMFAITDDTNADQLTLDHASGTSRYNKGSGFALAGEGRLYNLGTAPIRNIWTIAGNRLVASNDLVWTDADADGQNDRVEVADSVINLQAQYGIDTSVTADGIIDDWTVAAPADWTRVLAVRFALLTRSPQWERDRLYEKDGTPNPPAPKWSASADAPFVMTNVDGTADDDPADTINNWRHYRYNVFEAVVPLRNTILGRQL
jgi:type IV pilus assembly protein PilW